LESWERERERKGRKEDEEGRKEQRKDKGRKEDEERKAQREGMKMKQGKRDGTNRGRKDDERKKTTEGSQEDLATGCSMFQVDGGFSVFSLSLDFYRKAVRILVEFNDIHHRP
jgi:hypothetical protein